MAYPSFLKPDKVSLFHSPLLKSTELPSLCLTSTNKYKLGKTDTSLQSVQKKKRSRQSESNRFSPDYCFSLHLRF